MVLMDTLDPPKQPFGAISRRTLLGLASTAGLISAASRFWESRPATQWTPDEVAELLRNSPWAKQVLAQYRGAMDDVRIQPGLEPVQGRGEQKVGECGLVPCANIMPGKVAVVWESAQPIREATHSAIPAEFNGRYVISVRGMAGEYTPERLASASDLSAKGKPPVQAGVVTQRGNSWLFGFSKELMPLDEGDRDVQFTVHTGASLTATLLRASFNPKEMIYRRALAL